MGWKEGGTSAIVLALIHTAKLLVAEKEEERRKSCMVGLGGGRKEGKKEKGMAGRKEGGLAVSIGLISPIAFQHLAQPSPSSLKKRRIGWFCISL